MVRSVGFLLASMVAFAGSTVPTAANAEGGSEAPNANGPVELPASVSLTQLETRDLKTEPGNEISLSLGQYTYFELRGTGDRIMDLTGAKVGIEYTRNVSLSENQNWFATINLRGSLGKVRYSTPQTFFIDTVPDTSSPSGYILVSKPGPPFSEGGIEDWYIEGRALVGKDFAGRTVGFSPYAGIGFRHLSNGKGPYSALNTSGSRTDAYLYVPLGATLRTNSFLERWFKSAEFNIEGDVLIRGWQTTRYSRIPPFSVPSTATAPAFAFLGTNDLNFRQRLGYGLRASAKLHLERHWSLEPYFSHWGIAQSIPDVATFRYTVNGQPEQYSVVYTEPRNHTNEFGLKVGFHF